MITTVRQSLGFTFEPRGPWDRQKHRGEQYNDITCLTSQIHINISYLPHYLSTGFIIYEYYLVRVVRIQEMSLSLYVFCRFAI